MKRLIILIGIIITFPSCQKKTKTKSNPTALAPVVKDDTILVRKALEHSRIDTNDSDFEIYFNNDTLKFVTLSKFMYHPFGRQHEIENIKKQITNSELSSIRLRDWGGRDSTDLHQITTTKSQMKFVFDEEEKVQQIVSATIVDTNFHFNNNINIGLTKERFLKLFFSDPPVLKANNIVLISAILGMEHYYYFKNDKLFKIEMRTDYMFEDK